MESQLNNDVLHYIECIFFTEIILTTFLIVIVLYYFIKIIIKNAFKRTKLYSFIFKDMDASEKNDITDIRLIIYLLISLFILSVIYFACKGLQFNNIDGDYFIYTLIFFSAIVCVFIVYFIYNGIICFKLSKYDNQEEYNHYDRNMIIVVLLCIILTIFSMIICYPTELFQNFLIVP